MNNKELSRKLIEGVEDFVDYNKYLGWTPETVRGCQYYILEIPEGVKPPSKGENLKLGGKSVIVTSVETPDDIAKGRGGPVANSMRKHGICWKVNCLPVGHKWLERK